MVVFIAGSVPRRPEWRDAALSPSTSPDAHIDFDLHGIVGIRLIGATARDVAAVSGQLGHIRSELAGEPDIVIRFVERLPHPGARCIGLRDAAFTDEAFFVLRGQHKARVRVQLPVEKAGQRCEIVCQTGVSAVPLLIPIINLTALAKGVVPLHAAAFVHRGVGVLVTGWAKGGKTETLLGFMANGARYVGDEWVYISADGSQIFGIPEPLTLWPWHLDELPEYRALLTVGQRTKLGLMRSMLEVERRSPAQVRSQLLVRRATAVLEQQASVQVRPDSLFAAGARPLSAPFDKIFLTMTHDLPRVTVAPTDALDIARRMVFSLQYERLDFLATYFKFRFAFPERRSALLEDAEALQRDALERAFSGKEAYLVLHPYPVPIRELYDAMEPYVG